MITFEHVTKRYPDTRQAGDTLRTALAFRRHLTPAPFTALDDVSFHLPAGGALGVIGRNGAGKSTLLKLLSRVARPSAGRIHVRGTLSSLLEVGAGFHPDLTGRENIFLAGAVMGMSPASTRKALDHIVAFSELEAFIDNPVRTYSSGMYLRLAFSIGIHLGSDILVIDEALAVGDRSFRARCLERIGDFRQQGGTLVLVSHDSNQLAAVCDTGMVLEHGRVVCLDGIDAALRYYS